MDSGTAKTTMYVLIVLAIAALFGVALLKFNQAAKNPPQVPEQTQAQRLKVLENSPGLQSPAARSFVQNESARQSATREAEQAVAGGQ